MGCEKIRELILEYPDGDLNQSEKLRVEMHLRECKECNLFFDGSHRVWNLLDKWDTVDTKEDFVTRFWDRVSKEDVKKGWVADFFRNWKLNWVVAVAVVVILVVGVISANILKSDRANIVFTEKDRADEELLIELDKAISRETAASLDIYGPWNEKLEENKGG